jgi:Ala-tRNA(Pro) deacylase
MSISNTLREYLENQGTQYDLVRHPRTFTSMETAAAAHVAGDKLAKSVVLEAKDEYVMAVIPSTHHLRLETLRARFFHPFDLVTEKDIPRLFEDCELGSIPALGQAYGMKVAVDEALLDLDEIYFESGDHTQLVHMSGQDFRALMAQAQRGHFAQHA